MPQCQQCNAALPAGAKFCGRCGAPVSAGAAPAEPGQADSPTTAQAYPPPATAHGDAGLIQGWSGAPTQQRDTEPAQQWGGAPAQQHGGEPTQEWGGAPAQQHGGEPTQQPGGEPAQQRDAETRPWGNPAQRGGEPVQQWGGGAAPWGQQAYQPQAPAYQPPPPAYGPGAPVYPAASTPYQPARVGGVSGASIAGGVMAIAAALGIVGACALPVTTGAPGVSGGSVSLFKELGTGTGWWYLVEPVGVAALAIVTAIVIMVARGRVVPYAAAGVLLGFGVQTAFLFLGYWRGFFSGQQAGPAGIVGMLAGVLLVGAALVAGAAVRRT